ncbi:hypothetical protein R1flu_011301 [Riccia fluitans]|uniref:DUF2235 domain-containing protein n=1 Tax=Riccia fluitans TaxID=41844 RepID=A0ABD1Z9X6_9MARC
MKPGQLIRADHSNAGLLGRSRRRAWTVVPSSQPTGKPSGLAHPIQILVAQRRGGSPREDDDIIHSTDEVENNRSKQIFVWGCHGDM